MGFWDTVWSDGWWLEHGLDGIVSGLVGGTMAGLALWATIRHERKIRQADLDDRELDRLKEVASRLRAHAYTAVLTEDDPSPEGLSDSQVELFGVAYEVVARAGARGSGLAPLVEAHLDEIRARARPGQHSVVSTENPLSKLHADLLGWLADPTMSDEFGSALAERAKREYAGEPFIENLEAHLQEEIDARRHILGPTWLWWLKAPIRRLRRRSARRGE